MTVVAIDLFQGLLFLLCALCPQDVSKIRVGKLIPHGIEVLRLIRDFLGVKFVIKPDPSTGTVILKCVGSGLKNLSRKSSWLLNASLEISFDDCAFCGFEGFIAKVHWKRVMILQFRMVLSAWIFHLYHTITCNLRERGGISFGSILYFISDS
jgi:hypothetical protein